MRLSFALLLKINTELKAFRTTVERNPSISGCVAFFLPDLSFLSLVFAYDGNYHSPQIFFHTQTRTHAYTHIYIYAH